MARPSNTTERREQIANALERVMATKGYAGASIGDVATEAGLTPGLVHYHFASKLEILEAVLARLIGDHQAALRAALERCASPQEELAAFIDVHLATGATARPHALACWVTLSAEALREEIVQARFEAALRELASQLEEILRRGARQGAFRATLTRPSAAARASAAILATIQGYYALAATARSLVPRGSAAEAMRQMTAGLVEPSPLPRKSVRSPARRSR